MFFRNIPCKRGGTGGQITPDPIFLQDDIILVANDIMWRKSAHPADSVAAGNLIRRHGRAVEELLRSVMADVEVPSVGIGGPSSEECTDTPSTVVGGTDIQSRQRSQGQLCHHRRPAP